MIDYHIHPNYSPDAQGTIADFCQKAMEIGLRELCFTTHYEPDPARAGKEWISVAGERMPVESDWIEFYFEEIEKKSPGVS